MDLVDVPCTGGSNTWFRGNGKAMSRLDRFLLSNKLIEEWNVTDQRVGKRDISDHSPIWLNSGKKNWGPKPFRFNNAWFNHELFKPFIKEEWSKLIVEGNGDFILYEKLKLLKQRIRDWNRDVFGWIDLRVIQNVDNLNELDSLLVDHFGGNIRDLVTNRSKVTKEIWNTLNMKESMIRLKSRQLWLEEGNKNTRFFHNSLKERYRRNIILAVEGENGIEEGVEEIKGIVKTHFEDFFKEGNENRAVPEGIGFKKLNMEESKFMTDFHRTAKLTKVLTSSFTTLIPKVNNPQSLKEYRPICLVGSLHKILTKLLAAKVKKCTWKIDIGEPNSFYTGKAHNRRDFGY
ncbi:uncharacterized protein LOC131632513 [Vicia villosa]|uniref:uncharacterized protein LOC131632513 n=1 Tax=Vicia villosa TaxID=3911 RepID=UPI00273A9971|nr:uncharacterized protein LOC131632513 [Vicia villosa]